MKTTYRFIIAALAAAVALSSCTKDIAADREGTDPQDGVRTIAISFDTPTKTFLGGSDGLTPQFKGDGSEEIIVSNGDRWQKLKVKDDGNGAYITTELSGKLDAVYPSKYAKIEGVKITGVIVPSNQTGRFADANIATATIGEGETSATFTNQTAILRFYVDESIGVKTLQIMSDQTSANPVPISDGYLDEQTGELDAEKSKQKDFGTGSVVVIPEKDSLWTLADQTDDPQRRVCYVAVRPSNTAFTMAVASRTNTQLYDDEIEENAGPLQAKNKGLVMRVFNDVTLSRGTMANVFIPYYIKVNVSDMLLNPVYQYWAYCNIGAFLPEEPGYYYSWGNTDGHWLNAKSDGYQFTNEVYSGTQGGKITESRLTPEFDAACVAWGDKWRMPTKSESVILKEQVSAGYRYEKNGYCFGDLFLPAAGHIAIFEGSMVQWNKDTASEFWTSDIYSDSQHAYYFYKCADSDSDANLLYEGIPIRPIYGAPAEEGTSVNVEPIDPLTEGRVLY